MHIAIVGAGPAGSHLACQLAGAEHEILLFDTHVPWEKPCGGGLSPLVGQLFADVMALPFPRHCPPRLLLRASDGSQVEQALNSSDWAIVSRADLGRALLEHALANGRVCHIHQRVTDVQRTTEGWSVRTSSGKVFCADFLVGADGVQSIVRRHAVGPIPQQHLSLAVGYRVQGAPQAMVLQTFRDLEGYLWSFPRRDHASVGIGSRLGTTSPRDLWQRVDQFLGEACPEAKKRERWSALLPTARDSTLWETPCVGPGWALLGDAAGHVHPLTGEGIAYALWSAELLAEALKQGDPQVYETLWREQYGQGFVTTSEMLNRARGTEGTYEVMFHLATTLALRATGP